MERRYRTYNLEDFILDQDFFRLAKAKYRGSDNNTWDLLLQEYPEHKIIIEKAYRIINGIRIEEIQVVDEKIRQDFLSLEKRIKQRKDKKLLYWISSAAACFIISLSGLYFFDSSKEEILEKNTMLTQLATIDTESDDIQIIHGEDKNSISENNATIREEEDGTLIVNDKPIESGQESEYVQLIVPKGKRSFVVLKDGSRIWVNSGTKLLYPSKLDNNKREIYVDGEIYLEVAKNPSLPFFVHTANLDVKVLGTSFNVSAYADDPFSEVVLVTGSVDVNTNEKEIIRLVPNTRYYLDDKVGVVQQVDVYNYICWKDGIIKLEGEELQEVFKRLSRYYNVKITASPDIDQVRYFGKLSLEDTLENVLYNISLVEPIEYEKEDGLITIRRKISN